MEIYLIAAVTSQGVIGKKGALPWYIPEDLKRFKKITTGKTVLMGRTTYETIGRPLPNRQNIVLDREQRPIEGAHVCGSLDEALVLARQLQQDLYVIGGASVYQQMLPYVKIMHLSHVKKDYEGDVFFPDYDKSDWEEVGREDFAEFVAVTYERKTKKAKRKTTAQSPKQTTSMF